MYNKRKWLNDKQSSSTGSIVCFSGLSNWSKNDDKTRAKSRFVEISDCHNKIRIHQGQFETKKEYIMKIIAMKEELQDYIVFLQSEKP